MYITMANTIELSVPVHSFRNKAESKALIDSGATENFIDYCTVTKLRLRTRKLEKPRTIFNVDKTLNTNGSITQSCDLYANRGNKKVRQQFYVTNLGRNEIILGYPWLREFNLEINWQTANVLSPRTTLETITKG